MFSCEFCKISNNTFFIEHLWATASVYIFQVIQKGVGLRGQFLFRVTVLGKQLHSYQLLHIILVF